MCVKKYVWGGGGHKSFTLGRGGGGGSQKFLGITVSYQNYFTVSYTNVVFFYMWHGNDLLTYMWTAHFYDYPGVSLCYFIVTQVNPYSGYVSLLVTRWLTQPAARIVIYIVLINTNTSKDTTFMSTVTESVRNETQLSET